MLPLIAAALINTAAAQSGAAAKKNINAPITVALEGVEVRYNKQAMVKVELYFGLTDTNGKRVPPRQWMRFLKDHITTSFPEGLTMTDGNGQWLNSKGQIIKEHTKIVTIVCDPTEENMHKIAIIKTKYCRMHSQESVMELDAEVRAAF